MSAEGSKFTVVVVLVGNAVIAVAKLTLGAITGSAAMLSEGYHSVADVGNQGLLLGGMSKSTSGPSVAHPFGRGKEIYFWSFMVAVMLFVGGAVLSFSHGIDAIRHPHPIENLGANFIVLAVALVIEGYVFAVALRHFNKERGSRSLWRQIRVTKDTPTLVVLLEDSAAMVGLTLAAAGLGLTAFTDNSVWDGVASIAIGLLLSVVAWVLATETKALLIGEAASRTDRASMRLRILSVPEVESVGRLLTMHMGPDEILVNADVDLTDDPDVAQVEAAIDKVESAIREVLPSASNIFVELESRRG
ncbi:MAG: cation diffusion facilitator family transporter [Acidimicrobiia bacterium]|nr:cation diffusion facilitator family transporter [Acidimicrobiia bacterium]